MLEIYELLITAFTTDPIGQSIGMIAFVITMYGFGLCKDKKFIYVMMFASLFWGLHFAFLSALAAAGVHLFDILKSYLAIKYEKNNKVSIFCIIVFILIGIFAYKDAYSLIPVVTSITSVFLVFYVRGVWLNIGYLGIIICWFGYNLHNWSIGGMLSDIVLLIVGIAGVIRILLTEKKGKESE